MPKTNYEHYHKRRTVNCSANVFPLVFIFSAPQDVPPETRKTEVNPVSEIRILIVDDHEAIRQGVRSVLTQYVGWEVCGEAVDGEDAIAKAKSLEPDVIVLDIRMPKLGGLEAAKAIKTQLTKTKILFLTQHDAAAMLPVALQSGGQGLVSKYDMDRHLIPAIEALLEP